MSSSEEGPSSGWVPATQDGNQWMQIDLQTYQPVTGLVLQGHRDMSLDQYVKTFKIAYSHSETYVRPAPDASLLKFPDDFEILDTVFETDCVCAGAQRTQVKLADDGGYIKTRFIRILPLT